MCCINCLPTLRAPLLRASQIVAVFQAQARLLVHAAIVY